MKLTASRRAVAGRSRCSPAAHFRNSAAASSNVRVSSFSVSTRPSVTARLTSTSILIATVLLRSVAAKPVGP